MAIKFYTKQFAGMLPVIFEKQAHFMRSFGGKLQVKDGVSDKDTFMTIKISSDVDAVLNEYNTGENIAFGSGTGTTNRFGERKEIVSTDVKVDYDAPLAIHEGIDKFTVNDIPEQVVAERLAKHAEAWMEKTSRDASKLLSDSAHKTLTGKLNEEGIVTAFNQARKTFINNKVSNRIAWVAYVTPDVYTAIVDAKLTTTAKQSSANVETGTVQMFKGFVLVETPDEYFQTGEQIMFVADNVGILGIGISVARTIDSEDFAGVALQGAAKHAKYLPDPNKKAIVKAKLTPVVA